MKRKIEDTNFTPFSLPTELMSSSAVRNLKWDCESTFPKVERTNPKVKNIDKLQLYREAAARKLANEELLKSPSISSSDPNITQPKDMNVCEQNISGNVLQKSQSTLIEIGVYRLKRFWTKVFPRN